MKKNLKKVRPSDIMSLVVLRIEKLEKIRKN